MSHLATLNREFAITASSVTGTSLTDVDSKIPTTHLYDELNCEVSNGSGADTLTDFAVLIQQVEGGAWTTLISGADWDSESIFIKPYVSNTGLNTLAADNTISLRLSIGKVFAIKFQASVASGAASLTIKGVLTQNGKY